MTQHQVETPTGCGARPAGPAAAGTEPKRILVVDDDDELRSHIAAYLRRHGFRVEEARDGAAMERAMASAPCDLIVLDIMLPGEDGLSICRRLVAPDAPQLMPQIIMLSAMGEEIDRIVGLELGADDYLPKPCSPRELLARIRAVLRRREGEDSAGGVRASAIVTFDGFQLDMVRRRLVAPNGSLIVISNGEFALLMMLLLNAGQVLSREILARSAQIGRPGDVDRAVDMLVSRLRRKLQVHAASELIATVRGQGYCLAVKPEQRLAVPGLTDLVGAR